MMMMMMMMMMMIIITKFIKISLENLFTNSHLITNYNI